MNHTKRFELANEIENIILEIVDEKEFLPRGDLQGIVMVKALEIIKLIEEGQKDDKNAENSKKA